MNVKCIFSRYKINCRESRFTWKHKTMTNLLGYDDTIAGFEQKLYALHLSENTNIRSRLLLKENKYYKTMTKTLILLFTEIQMA